MKTHCISFILLYITCSLPLFSEGRTVRRFNWEWRFMAGDTAGAEQPQFDDSHWQKVDLPHDFQIGQPWQPPALDDMAEKNETFTYAAWRGFKPMGVGWYRKTFTPDEAWKGRRVLFDFEGIMYVGDVYLNGQLVGGTDYGYVGFETDVTGLLEYGRPNVLAVRADTRQPGNSRWYTGGGLYRHVNLVITDPEVYLMRHPLHITTPKVSETEATVSVQAEIACHNGKTVKAELLITDAGGREVARQTQEFKRLQSTYEYRFNDIGLQKPELWDCDTPHLYTAQVTVFHPDGRVADRVAEQFGVRSVEFSPAFGMKLNGRKLLLKGVANHHSLGALGAAAYPRAIEKRILLLKEFGVNHIRTSHNPYSEDFMDLCDKHGILVVDELYDKWLDRFCGGRVPWTALWQKDIPEWVKRDRNHPSVVIWSLGNELQSYWNLPHADWGITPYRMQRELLKRYDDTRPVTVAMHPSGRHMDSDTLPAPLVHETDIASYNYRYNYFPTDGRNFPNLIFYQSEANTTDMGPNWLEMDHDKVVGAAYWGQIDYLGESNTWPAKGWAQGAFDMSLQPKPVAYLLKSLFREEPVVHIGILEKHVGYAWQNVRVGTEHMNGHWNHKENEVLSLYTYTNCDEVELLVNGKSLGIKKNLPGRGQNKVRWDRITFMPGCIEAVGRRDGKEVARHRIETAGDAVRLVVEPDNGNWKADGMDLQHLRILTVDEKGRRVYHVEKHLRFSVEGDACIVGVDNGNIISDELHTQPERDLYRGSALVILRAGREPGEITLVTECEGFPTVYTRLKTK